MEANLCRLAAALQDTASLLRVKLDCTMSSLNEMPTCHALAEVTIKPGLVQEKSYKLTVCLLKTLCTVTRKVTIIALKKTACIRVRVRLKFGAIFTEGIR